MRTAIILVLAASLAGVATREASAGGAARGKPLARLKAAVAARAQHIPGGHLLAGRKASHGQKLTTTRAQKRDLQRGQALADVHRTGRTRVRSWRDVAWHPVTHAAIAAGLMVAVGMEPGMTLIAAALTYFSSRSAKKTSDGWLKLENRSIDVLERDGPDVAKRRFAAQGARRPEENLDKLRRNRHLRNGSFE
jgi:Ni/Co efflux regulator RcnB